MGEIDKDMLDLARAERKVERLKKEYNFRTQEIKCCGTCKHSSQETIESSLECNILTDGNWAVSNITELDICNKYEAEI